METKAHHSAQSVGLGVTLLAGFCVLVLCSMMLFYRGQSYGGNQIEASLLSLFKLVLPRNAETKDFFLVVCHLASMILHFLYPTVLRQSCAGSSSAGICGVGFTVARWMGIRILKALS